MFGRRQLEPPRIYLKSAIQDNNLVGDLLRFITRRGSWCFGILQRGTSDHVTSNVLFALDAIPAGFLRSIKGLIRTFEDRPYLALPGRSGCHADTDGERNGLTCAPDMYEVLLIKGRSELLRDLARLFQICVRQSGDKLLAAKPRKDIHLAAVDLPHLAKSPQDFVAGVMAVSIVDGFEVVYIQHED